MKATEQTIRREIAGMKRDVERVSELGLELVRVAADVERHAYAVCGGAGGTARRRAADRALGLIASVHAPRRDRRVMSTGKGRSTGERGPGRPAAPPPSAAEVARVKKLRKDGKTFQQIDRAMGRPDRHGAWSWTILNPKPPRKKTQH